MRVNIYAEELTNKVEIISKEIEGHTYNAVRFYLELPVTIPASGNNPSYNTSGPFIHRPGDDDSAAVTFWGRKELKQIFQQAVDLLEEFDSNELAKTSEIPDDYDFDDESKN